MGKTYGKSNVYCALQVSWRCWQRERGRGNSVWELGGKGRQLTALLMIQNDGDTPSAEDMTATEAHIAELQSEETQLKEQLKQLAVRKLSLELSLREVG